MKTDLRPLDRPLDALARASGRRGRMVAARLDLVISGGAAFAWRRLRAERRLSALGTEVRNQIYERIWAEAAEQCGADWRRLAPGLLELSSGSSRTRVYQQIVELDDPVTLQVALNKSLVYELLAEAGVPHPEHIEWATTARSRAAGFLAQVATPCVVKPAAGTGGGHGVVPGVESEQDLRRAAWHAAGQVDRLLIERLGTGDVYRLLLLDGELLDVVRSVPASVTGDGRSTLESLIATENERRVAAAGAGGLSLIGLNLDTLLTLRRSGVTLSTVLPAGKRLQLRLATNNNAAEDNRTWKGEMSPSVLDDARAAAKAVGVRLAGIDVITSDPALPLSETGGAITDVNGTPGLHHHYLVAEPEQATKVAIPVLRALLAVD